jgi:hypothetical protein
MFYLTKYQKHIRYLLYALLIGNAFIFFWTRGFQDWLEIQIINPAQFEIQQKILRYSQLFSTNHFVSLIPYKSGVSYFYLKPHKIIPQKNRSNADLFVRSLESNKIWLEFISKYKCRYAGITSDYLGIISQGYNNSSFPKPPYMKAGGDGIKLACLPINYKSSYISFSLIYKTLQTYNLNYEPNQLCLLQPRTVSVPLNSGRDTLYINYPHEKYLRLEYPRIDSNTFWAYLNKSPNLTYKSFGLLKRIEDTYIYSDTTKPFWVLQGASLGREDSLITLYTEYTYKTGFDWIDTLKYYNFNHKLVSGIVVKIYAKATQTNNTYTICNISWRNSILNDWQQLNQPIYPLPDFKISRYEKAKAIAKNYIKKISGYSCKWVLQNSNYPHIVCTFWGDRVSLHPSPIKTIKNELFITNTMKGTPPPYRQKFIDIDLQTGSLNIYSIVR